MYKALEARKAQEHVGHKAHGTQGQVRYETSRLLGYVGHII